jgi:hypothetical protein
VGEAGCCPPKVLGKDGSSDDEPGRAGVVGIYWCMRVCMMESKVFETLNEGQDWAEGGVPGAAQPDYFPANAIFLRCEFQAYVSRAIQFLFGASERV